MSEVREALLEISTDLLLQVLCLPPDTKVLGALGGGRSITLRIMHDDLDRVAPGAKLPAVSVLIRRNADGKPEFVGWEK